MVNSGAALGGGGAREALGAVNCGAALGGRKYERHVVPAKAKGGRDGRLGL